MKYIIDPFPPSLLFLFNLHNLFILKHYQHKSQGNIIGMIVFVCKHSINFHWLWHHLQISYTDCKDSDCLLLTHIPQFFLQSLNHSLISFLWKFSVHFSRLLINEDFSVISAGLGLGGVVVFSAIPSIPQCMLHISFFIFCALLFISLPLF